jgi:hypothetical protein
MTAKMTQMGKIREVEMAMMVVDVIMLLWGE